MKTSVTDNRLTMYNTAPSEDTRAKVPMKSGIIRKKSTMRMHTPVITLYAEAKVPRTVETTRPKSTMVRR